MTDNHLKPKRVLYHVVCAAPPTQRVQDFIALAQSAQWKVCVLATPNATNFIDIPMIEALTGYPVRSEYKHIGTPDVLPKMDAMVVAPITLNTTTKWAQGNADNLALSQLCKGLGLRLPIVTAPCITGPFANHPAYPRSIQILRECGVKVLYDPDHYPAPRIVPWETILETLNSAFQPNYTFQNNLL